jgi:hypothetical protein
MSGASLPIVAECPVCRRDYVWVPKDGGSCVWCRCKLVAKKEPKP